MKSDEEQLYAAYNTLHTSSPAGMPLCSLLFLNAPTQWVAPSGEDLAAGEAWSQYPRFWTLTS